PMGSQRPPLAALYLPGLLVISCLRGLGGFNLEDSGLMVRLSGSGSHCQGLLEVKYKNEWHAVHSRSWGQSPFHREDPSRVLQLCQDLQCGQHLLLAPLQPFSTKRAGRQITCHGPQGSFTNCSCCETSWRDPLALICLEPPRTTPPPTTPPPTTTPEPTAPPRLRLVAGPGGLRCAGLVEFYRGSLGGTIGLESQERLPGDLGDVICAALQCGSFLKPLTGTEAARAREPGESQPLPVQWKIQNPRCASLDECFAKVQLQAGGQVLGLVCSDFQPKVQSRLVGGSGTCEGSVEVRQGKQWDALCDSPSAKSTARWEEVCQEQQCGSVSSYRLLDDGERTSRGLFCPPGNLSQCHQLLERKSHCKRVFVTCQKSSPASLGAGAVMSIILALVLLAVLLVVCGPLAYKKLVKKFRQKKQRQWIGPTGMNQNMSFHRNHTVTVRSHVENPTASHVENEYTQPPRNSQTSAYPALEGALRGISAQPDNSSDSDYDLHGAQRL
uniref:T-cell surface glycoprotein CD5 n=1 Tax=Catagonus wagneri TaxID=51154 RepID=A0A8C3YW41_9CETA